MSTTFSKKSKNLIFSSDVTVFSLHEQHDASVTYSLHLANAGSGGFSFDCPIGQSIGELSPCVPRFCYYERNCFVSTQSRTKSTFFLGKSGDFSFCIKFNSRYSQAFPFAFGWLYYNTGTLVCLCFSEHLFFYICFHLCAQICAVLICQILHDFPKRQFISPP